MLVVSCESLMPFSTLGLHPTLVRNVLSLGYTTPTPVQAQAIPVIRAGGDLIATAQTGTGKTAAFVLPVLHRMLESPRGAPRILVITPTRELAQQVEAALRGFAAGTGLRSTLIVGGAPARPQDRALRSGVEAVVAKPGRVLDTLGVHADAFAGRQTLALAEAAQMFDRGFLPDLKRIIARLPARRQTLLFSATMPPEVARLASSVLRDPKTVAVGKPGTAAVS